MIEAGPGTLWFEVNFWTRNITAFQTSLKGWVCDYQTKHGLSITTADKMSSKNVIDIN